MKQRNVIAVGRISELLDRQDADRIAYWSDKRTKWQGFTTDYEYKVFSDRNRMIDFIKRFHNTPDTRALVKDRVHPNMLVDRRYQEAL